MLKFDNRFHYGEWRSEEEMGWHWMPEREFLLITIDTYRSKNNYIIYFL